MKLSILGILTCPACGGELKFSVLEAYPRHDSEVDEATLACKRCARDYPVVAGVPRLLPSERAVAGKGEADLTGPRPGDQEAFLEETMLPLQELSGKLVLDAGGGSARFNAVALSQDAEVVALDGAETLDAVVELAKMRPKLHAVEGDPLNPPFKKGAFDVVYSRGVLHRAGDARAAFHALADLVKPRGYLSAWLQGAAGPYADFATSPLKADCGWIAHHRRLSWLIVLALSAFGRRRHTKEDLQRWCEEEGFSVLNVRSHGLMPTPGVLARRKG